MAYGFDRIREVMSPLRILAVLAGQHSSIPFHTSGKSGASPFSVIVSMFHTSQHLRGPRAGQAEAGACAYGRIELAHDRRSPPSVHSVAEDQDRAAAAEVTTSLQAPPPSTLRASGLIDGADRRSSGYSNSCTAEGRRRSCVFSPGCPEAVGPDHRSNTQLRVEESASEALLNDLTL